jgi:diadenosine tetraphosphate (Ap4A) HIT family hydrolase
MAISQITMESQKQCIFCNLASERIIAENELCLAIRDGFPVSEGHTLIIPKRHVADYFDLTSDEIAAMQTMMKENKCQLDNTLHPDGYNVGVNVNAAAGQTVFHVHMHLIPRYIGDVENPKGGVRGVIPGKQKY